MATPVNYSPFIRQNGLDEECENIIIEITMIPVGVGSKGVEKITHTIGVPIKYKRHYLYNEINDVDTKRAIAKLGYVPSYNYPENDWFNIKP